MSTAGPFVSPSTPPPVSSGVSPPSSTPPLGPSLPDPAAPTRSNRALRLAVLREWATPILLFFLILTLIAVKFWPVPSSDPTLIDGVTLGRQYAPILVNTYSLAWDTAADNLAQGKTVSESQKAMQDTWKALRLKAFDLKVTPVLSQVLPEGTEPRDQAHRAQVARLWHDFAKGLRRGK